MDLRNMRHLGVRGLAVHCLSRNCGHQAVFSADDYPDDAEVASFHLHMTCSECGGKHVDVQPNWKEQPLQMSLTGKMWVNIFPPSQIALTPFE
jgi:hypothetical protein